MQSMIDAISLTRKETWNNDMWYLEYCMSPIPILLHNHEYWNSCMTHILIVAHTNVSTVPYISESLMFVLEVQRVNVEALRRHWSILEPASRYISYYNFWNFIFLAPFSMSDFQRRLNIETKKRSSPHGRAVEVYQHVFVGIEVERVHPVQPSAHVPKVHAQKKKESTFFS